MRAPKSVAVASKKIRPLKTKPHMAEGKTSKEKAIRKKSGASKDSAAPKRPVGAFFVFMEEFRQSYKENFPDNKSVSAVGKAGGEKWKSMSDAEKAPYVEKATSRKAAYEEALKDYKKKAIAGVSGEKSEASEKSTSEVQDECESDISS